MKVDSFPGTLTKKEVERPYISKTGRKVINHVRSVVLTPEQEAWLRRWFPEVENGRLMKASGMTHSTLHRFARELRLVKSEKGMRGIKRRQAAHVKRLCERNGYYDSLRGRAPSEATRKAATRMWQEVRDGKREHPTLVMKRKHPRKYKEMARRISEERKETYRKETRRMIYGLPRKTNLRIVMCKFTRSQTSHRHNALKRGYFFMADCSEQGGERYNIYYDDATQRAEKFERNLQKDGFNVLPYIK